MKYKLWILLFIGYLLGCKSNKYGYDPNAIKLNDTAVNREMSSVGNDCDVLKNSITLLDSAIKIDNNYIIAYRNKFNFQLKLGRYKDAVVTGKRIIKLDPNDIYYKLYIGIANEKTGDTTAAKRFYNEGLSFCNKVTDTMNIHNKSRDYFVREKAMYLILLYQQPKANDILKMRYDNETSWQKSIDEDDMKMTREKLIAGNTIDTTKKTIREKHNDEFYNQIKKSVVH